jgi:hypothetical protein
MRRQHGTVSAEVAKDPLSWLMAQDVLGLVAGEPTAKAQQLGNIPSVQQLVSQASPLYPQ